MNILLTSVGRRSYLVKYFKLALGSLGKVHVANSSEFSPAFQFADQFVVTPLIYDANYIPFLMKYCQENKIHAIISLFDVDLPILSRNKNLFREIGVKVLVSSPEVIDICNDKWKTYQYLKDNNFNVPQTYISLESAQSALNEGNIQFPVIIKPRWGMGSIAIYEADNWDELTVLYEKVRNTIQHTYLKYESAEDWSKSVIIQEKIHGQEYGLDIINDLNANYQTTICKKKYAMRSGETDCAVTVDNSLLKLLGKKLGIKLHHIGNLDCDIILQNGIPYILELNARFGGGYPFSHAAGVNLPQAIVYWLMEKQLPENLLSETFDVISQKDIVLVQLNSEFIQK